MHACDVLLQWCGGCRVRAQAQVGPALLCRAGPCARCEMVCGDPATGERSGPEPLLTLAAFRRERAAINFGVLLGAAAGTAAGAADGEGCGGGAQGGSGGGGNMLRVGTPVYVQSAALPPS